MHIRVNLDHYERMGLNSMQTSKSDVFRSRLYAKFGRIRHFFAVFCEPLSLVLIIRIRRKNTTVLAVLTVFLHDTAV